MLLAELGADYVAFGTDANAIDAIDQHAELIFLVVGNLRGALRRLERRERRAGGKPGRLGADFIAPSMSIWAEDDPPRRIAEIDNAIRRARRAA